MFGSGWSSRGKRNEEQIEELLSTVSHELRTPLVAVQGFGDTLLARWERLDEEQRLELVGRMTQGSRELLSLVDRLLDLSAVEAGEVEVRLSEFPLRDAVEACLAGMADSLREHRVRLEVPEDLVAWVDPEALCRILGNLLTNAVKYSPPGSTIHIGASACPEDVVVSVRDSGIGVPSEERERIFDRFYRGIGAAAGYKGTGVGLSIARRYVEMHGGRIWVEGNHGEGSTFSFTLPRAVRVGSEPSEGP